MTYTVEQLAAGAYDVLLDGRLVASLVREVDRSDVTRGWLVDLLDEMPLAERPAPFTDQQHTFATCTAALEWLGIRSGGESVNALEIEAQAKRRLADEYDAAQERGEVASVGKPVNVPGGNNKVRVEDLGLTRKAIHEARQIRDAEVAEGEDAAGLDRERVAP